MDTGIREGEARTADARPLWRNGDFVLLWSGPLIGLLGRCPVLWIFAGGLGMSALAAGLTDLRRQ